MFLGLRLLNMNAMREYRETKLSEELLTATVFLSKIFFLSSRTQLWKPRVKQPSEAVKPRRRRFDMQENVCKKYDITRKELQEGVNRYSDGDITEGAHHD